MNTTHDHTWFTEQLATYLADGLVGDERARFESHAATCPACAAELDRARGDEQRLAELFDDATPRAGFEDRIIQSLRAYRAPRLSIPTWAAKALATAAAVAIVGGVGYFATEQVKPTDARVTNASNLRQIGQASSVYSNDAKLQEVQLGFPTGTSEGAPALAGEVDNLAAGVRETKLGTENNHDEDRMNVLSLNGGVDNQPAPFAGRQPDQNGGYVQLGTVTGAAGGSAMKALEDPGQGLLVPGDAFKPSEFAFGQPVVEAGKQIDAVRGKEVAGAELEQLGSKVEEQRNKDAVRQDQQVPPPAQEPTANQPPATAPVSQRKVIRNGQIEFEVDSFDSALASVTKIASEESGFVATTNSEKLNNGKVKGNVVVRVPPDRLDTLVLKLRALGDLKRQNLTAQDVTKLYHDLESELRAARAMEERLIEIIKTGKGEIKDLLAAEKELANWRGKIEKIVGEINFYNNQVALSTLSIDLTERNIATAAAASEREDVNMGVETDDVEQARAQAIAAIDEAKGRILEAELKKLDAGQLAAKIVAEVPHESAGPVIDRLQQLGKVARMDVQRRQTTPSGTAPAPGARLERQDTRLVVSLYNLANVAPRQTSNLSLACDDVEGAYRAILERVEKSGGRVVSSALNREKADQVSGSINFETRSADSGPVLLDVRGLGEVMRLAVTENPDTANATMAKHGFAVQLLAAAQVPPRETVSVQLAARDVSQAYAALVESARKDGRVLSSQLSEQDKANVAGTIDLELPRTAQAEFDKLIASSGDVISRSATRSPDAQNTIDSKLRVQVNLAGADRVPPRETVTLGVQTRDVEGGVSKVISLATSNGGRVIDSTLAREGDGRSAARVIVEVPLAKSTQVVDQVKSLGDVRTERSAKNAQVPEGSLSRARLEVTLASPRAIVAGDEGLWSSIRKGLGTSFAGLMWSLQILVVGLCFVVPWVLLLWGGWKLVKRTRRATA